MSTKPTIIFMGTSAFAVPILESLNRAYTVVLVVTTPDKPAGRKKQLQPSPVKIAALAQGLPIVQPERLRRNDAFLEQLKQLQPDLIVVAAYGKIIPASILALPSKGCINVHPSLLPKYRGATPLQSALVHGDTETGTTIMEMDTGVDTGPILTQEKFVIPPDYYFDNLQQTLAEKSATLLTDVIPPYTNKQLAPIAQNTALATDSEPMQYEAQAIRWDSSATDVRNLIRAYGSTSGVYTTWKETRLNIHRAQLCHAVHEHSVPGTTTACPEQKKHACVQTSDGFLRLEEVQLAGKNRIRIQDFLNGHPDFIGAKLT